MSEPYLSEFLVRGRPPGSTEPVAWHINVEAIGTDAFGAPTIAVRQYNMTAAEAAGWTLPVILAGINTEVMKDCERLTAEKAVLTLALQAEIDEKNESLAVIDSLRNVLSNLKAVIENERAAFLVKQAEAKSELAELKRDRREGMATVLSEIKAIQRSAKSPD